METRSWIFQFKQSLIHFQLVGSRFLTNMHSHYNNEFVPLVPPCINIKILYIFKPIIKKKSCGNFPLQNYQCDATLNRLPKIAWSILRNVIQEFQYDSLIKNYWLSLIYQVSFKRQVTEKNHYLKYIIYIMFHCIGERGTMKEVWKFWTPYCKIDNIFSCYEVFLLLTREERNFT